MNRAHVLRFRPAAGRFLAAVAVIILLAACAPQGSRDGAEIAAGSAQWEQALNTKNVDALAAVYAEDCRLMPPNAVMGQGRGVVRETFGGMIAAGLTADLQTVETRIAADIGYHVGTYSVLTAEGAVVDRGKFIEVWRQVDGAWKIADDIWNSDNPADAHEALMMITHEVEDVDRWLAAWTGEDSHRKLFEQNGAPGVHVMRCSDRPDLTGLVVKVADMEAFRAFMDMPETAAAKKAAGVKDKNFHVFTEVK